MSDSILIEAPSRLHFGMFSFGGSGPRQYGGVGMMVSEPRLRVAIRPAPRFACTGFHAQRCDRIGRDVAGRWLDGQLPACSVSVESAQREHSGLGLGTQLTLAVAVGLTRYSALSDPPSVYEIAEQLGRARRSSVGTYGFVHGGLIVDAGHGAGKAIGALAERVELPHDWRAVLVTPRTAGGLSGGREVEAFGQLPPVPPETTGRLTSEVLLEMLPAIRASDFQAFSRSVYRFGRTAGECFAGIQGGPFTKEAGEFIGMIRKWGVDGVGQSSWGPTVFAFAESETAADRLHRRILRETSGDYEVLISRPDSHGAVVTAANTST